MKRSPFLRDLSRDHHAALSLANRIAKADGECALADLVRGVPEEFRRAIEPHFRQEEEGLLVELEQVGEALLVARTLAEHRHLRDLASRMADGDPSVLRAFGTALRDHVRFEERELFAAAELRFGCI
ncbi:MAG TPA: hemerythrin domain-containing protein [Rhodocyclaceae bacterium]